MLPFVVNEFLKLSLAFISTLTVLYGSINSFEVMRFSIYGLYFCLVTIFKHS